MVQLYFDRLEISKSKISSQGMCISEDMHLSVSGYLQYCQVELLFKKLEGLPENVKQSAFSKIQEKLPSQDITQNGHKSERKVKCKIRRDKACNLDSQTSHGDQEEYSVVNVLTSRGRNAKRLSLFGESSNRSVDSQTSVQESACSDESDTLLVTQHPCIDHQYEAVAPQSTPGPISGVSTCSEGNSDNSTSLYTNDSSDKTEFTDKSAEVEKASHVEKSVPPVSQKVDPRKTPYVCTECRKAYSTSYLLRMHMKNHRGEKDFQCDQCLFRTLTRANLNQHMIIHKNGKDYMCEYCGKQFLRHNGLQMHIEINHLREKKYSCKECEYKTFSKLALRSHMELKHSNEKNSHHICPVCGLLVPQRYLLLKHIKNHILDKPHKCDRCGKTFPTGYRLSTHVKSVHTPREFKCDLCSKFFQTKFHLQRHLKIHFNDKPFHCPDCNYASNTQGNLSKHVRKVHRKFDFSIRRLKTMKHVTPNNGNELQLLEKSKTIVKKYLEKLYNRTGCTMTLEDLCEQERNRKLTDSVLLPKNRKKLKQAHPLDHSYSSDGQQTIQVLPDSLLTTSDGQLLTLDPALAGTELILHSAIPVQGFITDLSCDVNPVEVMTTNMDVDSKQEAVVVIIGSVDSL